MPQSFSLKHAEMMLARTPGAVRWIVESLPREWHGSNYGAGTFSIRDIVSHYVHNEHTDWIPRMTSVLGSDEPPTFDAFVVEDHVAWNEGKTVSELLDEFETTRTRSLLTLEEWQLDEAALARVGIHPTLGEVTIRQLIATWVIHDLHHVSQLCKCAARQWTDESGPFCDYIGILTRSV
ncbi:MAG: DinB family protein [Phycisphaerales bacterium JB043]